MYVNDFLSMALLKFELVIEKDHRRHFCRRVHGCILVSLSRPPPSSNSILLLLWACALLFSTSNSTSRSTPQSRACSCVDKSHRQQRFPGPRIHSSQKSHRSPTRNLHQGFESTATCSNNMTLHCRRCFHPRLRVSHKLGHNRARLRERIRQVYFSIATQSSSETDDAIGCSCSDVNIRDHVHLLENIPMSDVRNFCFLAHVDHGKSSLSARLLEFTGNQGRAAQEQGWGIDSASSTTAAGGQGGTESGGRERIELLDTLAVEQERGITVKTSTASMLYPHPSAQSGTFLINMYDTPGHVDFGREVARSVRFVQGGVLLLDASQGIQAQTWSVHRAATERAKSNDFALLWALTKIDLDAARPLHVALQAAEWFEDSCDPDSMLWTSARQRKGIKEVLNNVCAKVPPPSDAWTVEADGNLRAQVVDSWYDDRGVNCLVQVHAGVLAETDRICMYGVEGQQSYSVQEIGLLLPSPLRTGVLRPGQMGYCRFSLRDPRQAVSGTLLVWQKDIQKSITIPFEQGTCDKAKQSVLYASVHPQEASEFEDLCDAVNRLALNDTGLEVQKTSAVGGGEGGGPYLGPGLRVGFQGLLHVEVFQQRLRDEFGMDAVVTPPKVPYRITHMPGVKNNLEEPVVKIIEYLREWPEPGEKVRIEEPIVFVRIMARVDDAGAVMELLTKKRATSLESKPMDEEKWLFTAEVPWGEVVTDFNDQLKTVTAGYGSLDTSPSHREFAEAKLSKVDIMLNGDRIDPLAFVCHSDRAQDEGRKVAKALQEVLPRQQFVTVIQATAEGKIVASERIKAYRKDVLTKSGKTVGGGDQTRKMKLLEKQKKGKKRMQTSGKVTLSQAAFNSVISRSSPT